MNYNLFQKLTEEQKEKYIVTSKSTDNYPHLYKPAYSPSRHFSACIENDRKVNVSLSLFLILQSEKIFVVMLFS